MQCVVLVCLSSRVPGSNLSSGCDSICVEFHSGVLPVFLWASSGFSSCDRLVNSSILLWNRLQIQHNLDPDQDKANKASPSQGRSGEKKKPMVNDDKSASLNQCALELLYIQLPTFRFLQVLRK